MGFTASIETLSLEEVHEVGGAYGWGEIAEAFVIGAGVGAMVSGGNPIGTLAGGAIAVAILHL